MRLFQPQPEGLGLFFLPTALSIIQIEQLWVILSALLEEKIASSRKKFERSTDPSDDMTNKTAEKLAIVDELRN